MRGSVAVREKFKDKEITKWIPFTYWGYADKPLPTWRSGDTLVVEGRLETYKKENDKYDTLQVAASRIVVFPSGKVRQQPAEPVPPPLAPAAFVPEPDSEEIPF